MNRISISKYAPYVLYENVMSLSILVSSLALKTITGYPVIVVLCFLREFNATYEYSKGVNINTVCKLYTTAHH